MEGNGKVIGIISIKGGVGKTSCALGIASSLASEFDVKTLVIDANYTAPNLGLHLGIINPEITLHDIFRKGLHLRHAIHPISDKLHIVPGSLIARKVNVFALRDKIGQIKNDYGFVILDSSPNLNEEMLSAIIASKELLVVTTPDLPTLNCTIHAIKVAKKKKTPIRGIILNKVRNKKYELNIEEIESACDTPVLAVLPDDSRLLEAVALAKPIHSHKPRSDAAIEYNKLAAYLLNKDYKDPRVLSRIRQALRSKIPKDELNRIMLKNN
jgi:MinD-like ATPase involved in chromosome partitioning or flagellar assembly